MEKGPGRWTTGTDGAPRVAADTSIPSGAGTEGAGAPVPALPCQQVSFLAGSEGSHQPSSSP